MCWTVQDSTASFIFSTKIFTPQSVLEEEEHLTEWYGIYVLHFLYLSLFPMTDHLIFLPDPDPNRDFLPLDVSLSLSLTYGHRGPAP